MHSVGKDSYDHSEVSPTDLDAQMAQAIFSAVPDGLIIVDEDGLIVLANPQAYVMFAWPEGQLVGSRIEDLIPPRFRAGHYQDRANYHAAPRVRPMGLGMELRAIRHDETEFPVEISLSPVTEGGKSYVVASIRDITERVEQQMRLAATREALQLTEDRERIARELHDTVIQRLFATSMGLEAALTKAVSPETRARLERSVDDLDTTIHEIRTAIFGLQGGVLASGVRSEVIKLVKDAAASLGFEPHLSFIGPVDTLVSTELGDQLLPTLREALSNVVRHANATALEVSLTATKTTVTLVVTDNGVGVAGTSLSSASPLSGFGVKNMTHRAESLGGFASLTNVDTGGLRLVWEVPVSS
ncbi:MAG: PAS domain S-box protein [Acidimicrobiia bacterium]